MQNTNYLKTSQALFKNSFKLEKEGDDKITNSPEVSSRQNIVRNYGGNDEFVGENIDLSQSRKSWWNG